jgi:hypothetical protein
VAERFSDDRVSTNEATLLSMPVGDNSPRLRYAGRPFLRLRRKEGWEGFNIFKSVSAIMTTLLLVIKIRPFKFLSFILIQLTKLNIFFSKGNRLVKMIVLIYTSYTKTHYK